MFRDEDIGCAAVDVVDEKFVIHSEIFGRVDKEKLVKVQEINVMIDENFKSRGVDKLYTYATNDEEYRFNIFLGYKPNGMELKGLNFDGPVYEFEKVLI